MGSCLSAGHTTCKEQIQFKPGLSDPTGNVLTPFVTHTPLTITLAVSTNVLWPALQMLPFNPKFCERGKYCTISKGETEAQGDVVACQESRRIPSLRAWAHQPAVNLSATVMDATVDPTSIGNQRTGSPSCPGCQKLTAPSMEDKPLTKVLMLPRGSSQPKMCLSGV